MLLVLIKALMIGFFASIGLGPVTVLVIKRGISQGWKAGFISGLGSAIVDSAYGTIAFIGAGLVLSFVQDYQDVIRLAMMFLLFVVAWLVWKSPAVSQKTGQPVNEKPVSHFMSTFSLALSNPMMMLVFLAIFATIPIHSENLLEIWPLVTLGLLSGTMVWWYFLSRMICIFRFRLPAFFSKHLNRISGIIIFGLGLYAGISGLIGLL